MKRRDFINLLGGAAATWPLTALAQQAAIPVIGFLNAGSPRLYAGRLRAFAQGLREGGFAEGQNVAIEYRWAEGQYDRLPAMAADVARRRVAVIVAGPRVYRAAKAATTTIPIVFQTGNDPVRTGLVASLSRPGGNLTGVSTMSHDLEAKRIGLLRELVPAATKIAALVDPNILEAEFTVRELEAAAGNSGLAIRVVHAGSARDFDGAFATIVREQDSALIVTLSEFFNNSREHLVALAADHGITAIYGIREFAEAGGLMSYGPSAADSWRQVGRYAARILKGEKPGDLPVVLPTKYELIINLKTAKTLGLTVSRDLLLVADDVIE
jgi:putative ABC transport system substrate-binding protein